MQPLKILIIVLMAFVCGYEGQVTFPSETSKSLSERNSLNTSTSTTTSTTRTTTTTKAIDTTVKTSTVGVTTTTAGTTTTTAGTTTTKSSATTVQPTTVKGGLVTTTMPPATTTPTTTTTTPTTTTTTPTTTTTTPTTTTTTPTTTTTTSLPITPAGTTSRMPPDTTPNGCICVTNGSCSLLGGNTTFTNDGTGQIDARIVNPAKGVVLPSGTNESIANPASPGIPIVSEGQSDCSYYSANLEGCCPATGYQCGNVFPALPGSRTLGGRAKFGEFPWQGIVFTIEGNYVGSGVLITQKHFLTVAHRLNRFPKSSFKIRLGDWDTSARSEPLPYMEFNVSKVTIHAEYVASSLKNSIAMLRLDSNVPLGRFPTISTACLPDKLITGLRCFVSGWGRNDFAFGSNQAIQRKVDVQIMDRAKCQATLRLTRLGNNFILDQGFMCAGGEIGKDACTGDGGAPLVCQVVGRWYVVGLVSWGISCGQDIPGVYMNVNNYIPWIQNLTSAP